MFNRFIHLLFISFETLSIKNNSNLDQHELPSPAYDFITIPLNANRLILDERRYDVDVLRESLQRDLASLNADQRRAFDALCEAVTSGAGGVFFLEGFGWINFEIHICADCLWVVEGSDIYDRRWINFEIHIRADGLWIVEESDNTIYITGCVTFRCLNILWIIGS